VIGSLPSRQQLHLSIVLPLRNQGDLTALLGRLYDPSSPDYRHFLSVEQFTDQFGPTADDYQTVVDFAQANGLTVTGRPANRLIVPVKGTVAQVERAFNVSMKVYQHPTEERSFFSPDREPSLNLSVPVAHIAGLNNFSIPRPMLTRAAAGQGIANVTGSGPGGSYLASDMRAAYYGGSALTGSGQCVGLFEFDGYNLSDVDLTFSSAGQSYSVPINNVLLNGTTGANVSGDDTEEVVDIVQAIGMAPGLSQVRVYVARNIASDESTIFNTMAAENICKQLSVSWSWSPDDPATDDYFFQEFAAQGQSLFIASGDKGAFDARVSPFFYPAEDTWVTAVGGTSLITNGAGGPWGSETAWDTPAIPAGSGGGISPDAIPIPSWQAGLANASNGGSTTVRNVPDVAMEADVDNYYCATKAGAGVSCGGGVGGTSLAAPRWAGFMALANQQAVAAGTAPTGGLGFINPAIYSIGNGSSYGADWHDIASGNNDCCGQSAWYSAVTGYDLVTGWGSPNGQNLINALAPLPTGPGFTLSASPGSLTLNPGASGTTTITVTDKAGFTGNVTLAASNLPSGVTASFGTNPTSGTSVLTLTAGASVVASSYYNVGVTGTSGSLTSTTFVPLTVSGFSLGVSPSLLTLIQNSSSTATIAVTDVGGFGGNVSLAASGLPSGVTASFGTNPTTGSSVLTLTASAIAAPGTSTVVITGTSAGVATVITTFGLTVAPPPGFILAALPGNLAIAQGSSGAGIIEVFDEAGFTGGVTLAASGLPSGVTASFGRNPTAGGSVLTVTASATAALGTASVTITGTSVGAASATATLIVTITAFTLSDSPSGLILTQGASGASTVTLTSGGGFAGNVTLAASGLPNGVTASFSPNPTTGSSVLTLTASPSAALGLVTVTITGSSAGIPSAAATLALMVAANVGVTNEWTWMSGSSTVPPYLPNGNFSNGNPGVYGTLAVPAAVNVPGGRYLANRWTDSNGNLWLFGGFGIDGANNPGFLNDLWEFSPSTTEWAWMGGGNTVPTNGGGNPGVYGALGVPAAGNIPGGRDGASSWTDSSGHLWLFGGNGYDANGNFVLLNDLWVLNPATNQWTWMGGGSTAPTNSGNPGVYGTLGVPAAGNIPGGRVWASSWTDGSGHLWLFGGAGIDAAGNLSYLNDLWEFNPATNQWEWMGGGSTVPVGQFGNPGVYGTLGVPAAANIPGSRMNASSWTDGGGHLWLFGGDGWDAGGNRGLLNDLWELDPATNQWAWRGGGSTVPVNSTYNGGNPGVYGELGVLASGNIPGGRNQANGWTDSLGYQWLFGGFGHDANGTPGYLNDLWQFNPATNQWAWMGGSSTVPSYSGNPGVYGTLGAASAGNLPGGRDGASSWTDRSGRFWLFGGLGFDGNGASNYLNDLWKYQPPAPVPPGFALASSPGSLTIVQGATGASTVTVADSGGFTGSVTLVASGLPSGVAASFSPNPTAGTSVFTLTASNSATPGSYSLTITGTSGTLTASASLALTIQPGLSATSTTLSSSANPSTSGQSVTFTGTVSPSTATGMMQFLDGTTSLGTATIAGGSASLATSTLAVGAHSITAVYTGDANDATSTSTALTQTINKAASSVTLVSSANPSSYGQSVTFTATVSPWSATGTVQFLDGTTVLGTATIANTKASLAIPTLAVGAHSITAVYSGDANYLTSTSAALAQTVNKLVSSVTLASSAKPSTYGQSVTFTATVSPSSGTGTVQFLDGATSLGTATIANGKAALAISTLAVGAHSITAVYSGDANDLTSTSAALAQTVNKVASSVTLASSVNPSSYGQSVTFTATVSPLSPTGTVQFLDGTTSLGTATIAGGSASLAISSLAVGAHSITAVYSGDANHTTSTSTALAQTVNKVASSVALASSLNPSTAGQSVTFTATVSPSSATGTVQFLDGTTSLGTATIAGGKASLAISTLASSVHSITAAYSGATNYATSTSAVLSQTVLPGAPTKLTATPASSTQINLAWTASPTNGVTYNVYSSTTSGFTPSAANRIASGLTAVSYSNTGLSASTTHYYVVTAQDSAGESAASNQVSATTPAGPACHVTYSVTSQWGNGFGTALTIQNTGSTTINNWNLTWTWPGNQKITQSWSAGYTQKGANATLTYESYNATIAPGATISGIGFNASYSGTNTAPSAFSVNGTLCK
jgi:N-acetylneuraminic acid mutarotase